MLILGGLWELAPSTLPLVAPLVYVGPRSKATISGGARAGKGARPILLVFLFRGPTSRSLSSTLLQRTEIFFQPPTMS